MAATVRSMMTGIDDILTGPRERGRRELRREYSSSVAGQRAVACGSFSALTSFSSSYREPAGHQRRLAVFRRFHQQRFTVFQLAG